MPGFYPEGEYDLAGFCVGIVNKADIINGTNIAVGDRIIGLGSTGIHSNGFSLVRKLYAMDDTLNKMCIRDRFMPDERDDRKHTFCVVIKSVKRR